MLSALEKSEKGARRMKRACDSFKLGDLVSWLILVYKVFPQMFKSDSFSCKGYNIWQSLKRMQHLTYELFLVIYLYARPLRALAPLGKIIKGVFFFSFWNTDYLVGCPTQLTCLFIILENGTVASWKHDDWWYGTFWIIYSEKCCDKIFFFKASFIGSRRILHIWQIFKFQIWTIDCSLCSCPWNLTANH